jgi:hypothetical protein
MTLLVWLAPQYFRAFLTLTRCWKRRQAASLEPLY